MSTFWIMYLCIGFGLLLIAPTAARITNYAHGGWDEWLNMSLPGKLAVAVLFVLIWPFALLTVLSGWTPRNK